MQHAAVHCSGSLLGAVRAGRCTWASLHSQLSSVVHACTWVEGMAKTPSNEHHVSKQSNPKTYILFLMGT